MKIDKKQIKAYSKEISKICKLWGYDPSEEYFEDHFEDASDFYFVPYIKELAENCDEDFLEELGYAIDEVYDSTVELTLDEVKDFIKDDISLKKYINNAIINKEIEPELVLDWFIDNSNNETIQKFVNWVLE